MCTAYEPAIFGFVRIKKSDLRSKNQRYANSFLFYAYSDKNTFKIVTKLQFFNLFCLAALSTIEK